MKLVFESCSPRRMLFRRLYNQPVVSKQLAGVPNSSTGPSLPPQQSFCSSVNSPLKGVEDFLDIGIYWLLLLPRQIVTSVSPFWTWWTWTTMNDLNRHCENFLHPFSSSFYVKLKVKFNDIAQTWWEGGWSCVELDNVVHPSPLQTPQMQVQEFWPKCADRHPLLLPNIQQSTQNNSILGICACSVFLCWNPSSGKGTAVFVFVSKLFTTL